MGSAGPGAQVPTPLSLPSMPLLDGLVYVLQVILQRVRARVCVCACVCVCERERERERVLFFLLESWSSQMIVCDIQ
jgi:hypothetical protein